MTKLIQTGQKPMPRPNQQIQPFFHVAVLSSACQLSEVSVLLVIL